MFPSILEVLNQKWAMNNVNFVNDIAGTKILLSGQQIGWLMSCTKIPYGGWTFTIPADNYKPEVPFDNKEDAKYGVLAYIAKVIDDAVTGPRISARMPQVLEDKFFAELAAKQKPTPADIQKTIDENFWEMLTGEKPNEIKA